MTGHSRSLSKSTVEVKTILGKSFSSNVFVVKADNNFVVDAGAGNIKRIVDYIDSEEIEIDRIILTHRHFDHVGGAKELSESLDAPLYARGKEAEALRNGDDRTIISKSFGKEIPEMDVKDLDEETYSGFVVIGTPGHTEDSICLYHGEEKILFSGDTVFSGGGAGRTDLPTGNFEEIKRSIEILTEYDVHSLYPGHGTCIEGEGNEHIKLSLKNLSYL